MKFYCLIVDKRMYEDELPEDLPDNLYDLWYNLSWVDGVRMGPWIEEEQLN